MNKLDFVIAIILLLAAYRGYKNGFLMGLISLVAIVLGILGGIKLMGEGMLFLQKEFNADKSVLPYLSFLLIFLIITLVVNMLGKIVKGVIDRTILGLVDGAMGAVLGVVKWLFMFSVLLWIFDSLQWDLASDWTENSLLYPYVQLFASEMTLWISDFIPFFKETFTQF